MPHYQDRGENTDTCSCGRGKSALEHVCSICYRAGWRCKARVPIIAKHRAVVIHDPSDTYLRGALFYWSDFRPSYNNSFTSTLDLGFWPPGLIVEDPRGGRWIVRGNEDVPASAPEEKFGPQWLEPVRGRKAA